DAATARVQHDPHAVALVEADLDEVVARAERAELLGRLDRAVLGQLGGGAVGAQPPVGGTGHVVVAPTHAGGDHGLDTPEQRPEIVGQLGGGEVQLGRDHAATDVHADRGGD